MSKSKSKLVPYEQKALDVVTRRPATAFGVATRMNTTLNTARVALSHLHSAGLISKTGRRYAGNSVWAV